MEIEEQADILFQSISYKKDTGCMLYPFNKIQEEILANLYDTKSPQRIAFRMFKQYDIGNKSVFKTCSQKGCINPEHLDLVHPNHLK